MIIGEVHTLADPKEREKILSIYDEESILKSYIDIDSIPCLIHSPLREDYKPSFSFFYLRGDLIYKDFSTGESGNVWTFLTKYTKKSLPELYKDILERKPTKAEIKTFVKPTIEVEARPFNSDDLAYWDSYGISEATLKRGNIHAIRNIILNREGNIATYPADKLAFVYVEFIGDKQVLKIYQPKSKMKWLSNFTHEIIDLYSILPEKGEHLIITSSRKDALTLMENCNIPAICFNSETTLPNYNIMEELKTRFKNVYVLYDNDYDKSVNIGELSANLLISRNPWLKKLTIPKEYEAKDPSDLVLKYNRNTLTTLIKKQL